MITDTDRLMKEAGHSLLEDYSKSVELAGLNPRESTLDVATGSGRMALVLAERGHGITSCDINEEAVEKARVRLGGLADRVEILVLDARELPFEDDSFSAVTCANAVHEMDEPRAVLREMSRVVRDDGRLVIIEFNERGYELISRIHKQLGKGTHRECLMSVEEIESWLKDRFGEVNTYDLGINTVWIAASKNSGEKNG